ncbi:MAG: archease [Candidatus Omnitrophica bacterium]|nr:archease [Candidatus Omnitrophota bacterium]
MIKKNYEFLEHTADIRIRVKAKDLKELFVNTALAMFDIMAEKSLKPRAYSSKLKKIKIIQKADGLEELLVNWLNELLSLSAVKELIFTDFKIKKLDENNLEAEIFGDEIKNYRINTEIKAATYHQLKLERIDSSWQAEVIFDV